LSEPSSYSVTPSPPPKRSPRLLTNLGFLSAVISLWILPEIFGSAAILLGAYAWRMEGPTSRNAGLVVIIAGIVCMLMGLYFTSYFGLYSLLAY
jgi:membrane-bound ClpP family serine protease